MMGAYVTSGKWILGRLTGYDGCVRDDVTTGKCIPGRLTGYDGCVRDEREVYPGKAHRI